jgi:peptidoglycan/LPS O-acetylase OafA/YrhL
MTDKFLVLRGFACILVFLSHIDLVFVNSESNFVEKLMIFNGFSGVQIFFVLSGYLIIKILIIDRKYKLNFGGILAFYKQRFFKIALPYYMVLIFLLFFVYKYFVSSNDYWSIIKLFGFGFDNDLNSKISNHLWSVTTEMQFYVISPIIALGFLSLFSSKKLSPFFVCLAIIIIGTFNRYFALEVGIYNGFGSLASIFIWIDLFLIGGICNYIVPVTKGYLQKIPTKVKNKILVGLLVLSIIMWNYWTFGYTKGGWNSELNYLVPTSVAVIGSIYIIISESYNIQKTKFDLYEILTRPIVIMEWFGYYSYYFYLVHVAVIGVVTKYIIVDSIANYLAVVFLSFVLGIGLSLVLKVVSGSIVKVLEFGNKK